MKAKPLGELEQRVMDIIWECGFCSVRDIHGQIKKNRSLAYTTVATILQRLYEKDLVDRKETKQLYVYSPKVSKEAYGKKLARSFLTKFIKSFGDVAITSFVDSVEKLPKRKRDSFIKLLKRHETAR